MRISVAQHFSPSGLYIPAKASLYLKKISSSTYSYFEISESITSIDATNWSKIEQSDIFLRFNDIASNFTGAGYCESISPSNSTSTNGPKITFPIKAKKDRLYYLWIRVKSSGSYSLKVFLDEFNVDSISGLTTDWTWKYAQVVVPDKAEHNISLQFNSSNVLVDKIVITSDSITINDSNSDYSDSNYNTVHVRLNRLSSSMPSSTYAYQESSKNTISDINDNWTNFDLGKFNGYSNITFDNLAIVVNSSGGSELNKVLWVPANEYLNPTSSRTDSGSWTINTTESMSFKLYSELDSVSDCFISTPDAELYNDEINDFSDASLHPKHSNTFLNDDEYGGNDVVLNISDKVLNLIIDQSGSLSWNDNAKLRYDSLTELITALENRYPGNIDFNISEIKGEPCFPFLIATKTPVISNEIKDIVRSHFEGDPVNFAGFRVVRREGDYPLTPIDGEIVFDGYGFAALDGVDEKLSLETNTQYYYKIYTYYDPPEYRGQFQFSEGIEIPVKTPSNFNPPLGLPNVKNQVFIGYDLQLDQYTDSLWNSDEGEGDYAYDFGLNGLYLTAYNAKWLDEFDCPAGTNGLRFNGISSQAFTEVTSNSLYLNRDFTVMGWFNQFENTGIQTILCRSNALSNNYYVNIESGTLKFYYNGGSVSCTESINTNEWYHFAITISESYEVKFYINGVITNTSTLTPSLSGYPQFAQFTLGFDPIGLSYFFGKISHISLHSVIRDNTYINASANPIRQTNKAGSPLKTDNGDRTVVFNYKIPSDYNYNYLRVVKNASEPPKHETDGDIILDQLVFPGSHILNTTDFYHVNHTYYFRWFTKNADENWCPIEDATLQEVFIPDIERPLETFQDAFFNQISFTPGPGRNVSLEQPQLIKSQSGREKNWLKWKDFSDANVSRVKIYFSTEKFPFYNRKTESIEGGEVIYDDIASKTSFVHRNLTNRSNYYYTIVSTNRFEQFSNLTQIQLLPLDNLDDTGIPLIEVLDAKYHILDDNVIQLTWKNPISISSSFKGYFDDRFYIYAAICDLYGNPIAISYPDKFSITSAIQGYSSSDIENVFNIDSTSNPDNIPQSVFSISTSGLITGTVLLRRSSFLDNIDDFSISVTASYKYSETFTFNLPTTYLTFKNPIDLSLINRDALYLPTANFIKPACDTDDASGGLGKEGSATRQRVNGTYIRRKKPYVTRALIKYKDNVSSGVNVNYKVYDASGGPCGISADITSESILIESNSSGLQNTLSPILDVNGFATAYFEDISFSDIFITAPDLPQSVTVFVKATINGFSRVRKQNIFFPTTLRVSLTASAPKADGIDTREEFARAWFIDPDYPTDDSKTTPVSDNTIAKWTMFSGGKVQRKIPFYSTDNVPLTDGVYSFTRSGTARMVFFGPAQAAAAGSYSLLVSITSKGLTGTATADLSIESRSGGDGFQFFIPDPTAPRILAEFDNCINYIWADGEDYQKMTITRSPGVPAKSATKYAGAFRECSEVLFPLPVNTLISIEAKGYEIIHGTVIEQNEDGARSLDVTSATVDKDTSIVKLSKDFYTYVYFRKPSFDVSEISCHDINTSTCVCFDPPEEVCYSPNKIGTETAVVLSTKINYNGKPLTIYGGGAYTNDSRPPTVLVPIDPLYIELVGLFSGDTPIDKFIADGTTVQTAYINIRYKGSTVPNNTPVLITLTSNFNTINGIPIKQFLGIPDYIFTNNTEDFPGNSDENNTGGPFSIASLDINPIPPQTPLRFALTFTVDYPNIPGISSSSSGV